MSEFIDAFMRLVGVEISTTPLQCEGCRYDKTFQENCPACECKTMCDFAETYTIASIKYGVARCSAI